jgi:hypothetical protein
MRTHLFALLVSVLGISSLVGCGGGSSNHDSSVPADMTAKADSAAPGGSCGAILDCAAPCTDMACQQTCVSAGSTAAQNYFNLLFACAYAPCLMADGDDAGAALCTSMSDVSATCRACVTQEATGAGCATQLANCMSN